MSSILFCAFYCSKSCSKSSMSYIFRLSFFCEWTLPFSESFFQMNFLRANSRPSNDCSMMVTYSYYWNSVKVPAFPKMVYHKPHLDDYNAIYTWARSHHLKMRLLFMLQQNLFKCLLCTYPAIQNLKRNRVYFLFSCMLLERIWGSY